MTLARLGYNLFVKAATFNSFRIAKQTLIFPQIRSRSSSSLTMPCREVAQMSDEEVKKWIESFDTVMTDCDGVLWVGGDALPGSPEMIQRFRALGKKVFYVTNNSTKHRREYKAKFDKLGFGGEMDEILGTAYLAAAYLEDIGFDKSKSVYVVGSTGITQELDDIGVKHNQVGPDPVPVDLTLEEMKKRLPHPEAGVGAVIVGHDVHFSFIKMTRAASYLSDPAMTFIATNTDEQFPMKGTGIIVPGTGAFVAAVETAACRKPIVLGKPSKFMFEIIQHRYPGVDPARTLMIGDRANTDILLGKNCGLQTLLVGSGCHSLQETRKWEVSEDAEERRLAADYYSDKLGDLLERITKL